MASFLGELPRHKFTSEPCCSVVNYTLIEYNTSSEEARWGLNEPPEIADSSVLNIIQNIGFFYTYFTIILYQGELFYDSY